MQAIPGNFFEMLPGLELADLINILSVLAIASLRIGSFLIASPLLGYRVIPLQVRIIASFSMAFLVSSMVSIPDLNQLAGIELLLIVAVELIIGVTSGLILTIIFSSAALAGEKIAATAGLSLAALMDPESGGQTPVVSQMMNLLMVVTFLSLNGHLLAISTILQSYNVYPIGNTSMSFEMVKLGIDAGGIMFRFGALIMLPVVIGLTLVNVIIGIVTRSAPTLNLFSFGFPITMITAFIMLYLVAGPIADNLSRVTEKSLDMLMRNIEVLY